MLDLVALLLSAAVFAAYMFAAGYLSYVWSEGNERIERRFHRLFIVFLLIVIAALQVI